MALETGTFISDLNSANPLGSDALAFADDHIRLLKSTIKATFPNISGAVTKTHTEINNIPANTSQSLTDLSSNKADKTTTISAGTGLSGGGSLAANRTISLALLGVATGNLADAAVTADKIAGSAVTIAKINDGAVTKEKLATDAAKDNLGYTPANAADFTQSLGSSGYQKLPNGLILQWGTYTSATDDNQTISFPIAFTTACYVAITSIPGLISTLDKSYFITNRLNIVDGTNTGYYIAIGK